MPRVLLTLPVFSTLPLQPYVNSSYRVVRLMETLVRHEPDLAADLADQSLAIDPRDAELLFLKGRLSLLWGQ